MKLRTDFVTNSSSSSYCVSLLAKAGEKKIALGLWPEGADGSADVYIYLNENVTSFIKKIRTCKTIEEFKELVKKHINITEMFPLSAIKTKSERRMLF